jgi:ferrochelatase
MQPIDSPVFNHQSRSTIGILLTNLGTPQAPTAAALRPYLKQFLSDHRVVDLPRWLWWPILNLVILRVRPRRSARSYKKVWTEQGSPLLVHTRDQANALQAMLEQEFDGDLVVEFGFRYGQPSIDSAVDRLIERGARKLLVLPLYPQYAAATGASTFDALAENLCQRRWVPDLRMVTHYHDHPAYIAALANSVRAYWQEHGRADKFLMSFHGIPERFRDSGDPYYCECLKTGRLLGEALGLAETDYQVCFQSRFGREEWLKPYTDKVLIEMAQSGTGTVQVICPGFAADCLETLEEIAIQFAEVFCEAGGDRLDYIPALNSQPGHIEMLRSLVLENLQGWHSDSAG